MNLDSASTSASLEPGVKPASPWLDRASLDDRIRAIRAIPFPDQPTDASNDFHDWLRTQVNATMDRISRSQRIEGKLRERAVLNAKLCWDSDRQIETEILGASLADDPTEVVAGLRRTPHGCEWLMKRWALLIYAAEHDRAWTLDQQMLAARMLGIPLEFQDEAKPLGSLWKGDRPLESTADLIDLARQEIKSLKEQRERVAPIDEAEKLLAQRDELADDAQSPEIRRIGREERGLYLRLRWLVRQLEQWPEDRQKALKPVRTEVMVPVEAVEEPPLKPVEPEPEPEPVQEPIVGPVVSDRCEAKLQKAEARRQAKARKRERMLA